MASPSYRCGGCKSAFANSRNLAVFIDGTSNKVGNSNTNVVKLFQQVIADGATGSPPVEQHKYYLKGIGAHDVDHLALRRRVGKTVYGGLEMALAWNVDMNVKNAYTWLAEIYGEGDQIYLFGFSRGAYQVRALASMIHEVGLVKQKGNTKMAYDCYLAFHPDDIETRNKATRFKQMFCWQDVRIHFVGVWDTVSSLGFIKRSVHITESVSVTNACHFRHALALDEYRVKFMPEYFLEMNANSVPDNRDVKEVWFAGSHSDVGGTGRPMTIHDRANAHIEDNDPGPYNAHAGNAPFLWMRQEAAIHDLKFGQREFTWDPKDIDFGQISSMTPVWKMAEMLPIRHQVSFSGTGKHARRSHLFRPRSVIPGQQIHVSAFSGDLYTPRAILEGDVCIPTPPWGASDQLWTIPPPDEEVTQRVLPLLLRDRQTVLLYLDKVLFLLDFVLRQDQPMTHSPWPEASIRQQLDPDDLFALAVIRDITRRPTTSLAKSSFEIALLTPDHRSFHRTLRILRFLTMHEDLRRFIFDDIMMGALVDALGETMESSNEYAFFLVVGSLRSLIGDNNLRQNLVNRAQIIQSKLSIALEDRSSIVLLASLKLVASLAPLQPGPFKGMEPKIFRIADKAGGHVGPAAVEALVALKALETPEALPLFPLLAGWDHTKCIHDVRISNVLGYLDNKLPRLDAEVGHDPLPNDPALTNAPETATNARVLDVIGKIESAIQSRDVHERTVATLTLLKLFEYANVAPRTKALNIFIRQLDRQETCLLAAYALKRCLGYNMWTTNDYERVAQLVAAMIEKNWFDGAIGRVEAHNIFGGLMEHDILRQQTINHQIVDTLLDKLTGGNRHEVRVSLSCLLILNNHNSPGDVLLDLGEIARSRVEDLDHKDVEAQRKSVKVLTALSQTAAGVEAIMSQVGEIGKMVGKMVDKLPDLDGTSLGPAYAVYNLSKNDALRKKIGETDGFKKFKLRYTILRSEMAVSPP